PAFGLTNAIRYAVTPRIATHLGRCRSALTASPVTPATSSAGVSSSARAVARLLRLVIPSPCASSSARSHGRSSRSVKPAPCRAGQKRLPRRAKCSPTAAEYRPGLKPQNSTRRPGPITSTRPRPTAAATSWRVGGRQGCAAPASITPILPYAPAPVPTCAQPERTHPVRAGDHDLTPWTDAQHRPPRRQPVRADALEHAALGGARRPAAATTRRTPRRARARPGLRLG